MDNRHKGHSLVRGDAYILYVWLPPTHTCTDLFQFLFSVAFSLDLFYPIQNRCASSSLFPLSKSLGCILHFLLHPLWVSAYLPFSIPFQMPSFSIFLDFFSISLPSTQTAEGNPLYYPKCAHRTHAQENYYIYSKNHLI